jgi:prepilin-type processing-associated H-X9-DG protein
MLHVHLLGLAQPCAFAARSRHPGGVNVALCDSSCRFIAEGIAALTWQQLGTSQGGDY